MTKQLKDFSPILVLFLILTAVFVAGGSLLKRMNASQEVLIMGNLLLFVITLLSFFVARRGLKDPNPHAFVRAIYSGMLIKLFICIIAATVYLAIHRTQLNKPGFFTLMGLYLVYTGVEVSILTKLLKNKANG